MEMIHALIADFYAIPAVDGVVQNNAILRLAVNKYGTPMFLLGSLLIILLLTLIIKRIKPKAGRPKPIVEKKEKPAKKQRKAKKPKPAKAQKVKGTPASIIKKLDKLPASSLPLYPVADKRKPLANPQDMAAAPLAPPPSLDDASLIAGLDAPDAPDVPEAHDTHEPMPAPSLSSPVKSFTLDEKTASTLLNQQAASETATAEDDFDIPADIPEAPSFTPSIDDEAEDETIMADSSNHEDDLHDESLDNLDLSEFDLPEEPALSAANDTPAMSEVTPIEPVPSLDFAAIEELPPEPKPATPDDDTELDIPVASFGEAGDVENLSSSAQQKLAELNDRGVT